MEVIEFLLRKGANKYAEDSYNLTPEELGI